MKNENIHIVFLDTDSVLQPSQRRFDYDMEKLKSDLSAADPVYSQ